MKLIHSLLLSHLLLTYVSGRKTSGGSGGSYSRPRPQPRPTTPSASRPSSPTGSRPSRDDFASGFKPTSTTVNNKNPNPAYKPTTPQNNAPTLSNGGGGYYYAQRSGFGGGSLFFAAASGYLLGSFLYGGYNTRPSCRQYSGYNNGCYGQSTTGHQCKAQIPMCPLPESIRSQWYTGSQVTLSLLSDNATCTILNEATATERSDSNVTTANLTLAECMQQVVRDGNCDLKAFTYDESTTKCGCCSSFPPLAWPDSTSAVYSYSTESPLEKYGSPTHCISGATLYWPRKIGVTVDTVDDISGTLSGGGNFIDDTYDCRCGDCNTCGAPDVSYMDWAGPFTVPQEIGEIDAANSNSQLTKPRYDPVDTCVCGEPNQNCNFIPLSGASWVSSAWAISSSIVLLIGALA